MKIFALFVMLALPLVASAQQRPAITGLAYARFATTHPEQAAEFYGKTLGFERVMQGDTWRYPVNAAQWFEVVPMTQPPAANLRMLAVGFTTNNVKQLADYLVAHRVKLAEPVAHGHFAVFDPEGNRVEFVQATTGHKLPLPHAISRRIIHAGFYVQDAAKEDDFYRDLLGFRPYWHGGMTDAKTEFISLQVPDGTDWVEYMLTGARDASLRQMGMDNHFSLGVEHMPDVVAALKQNGCTDHHCNEAKMGRDGKVQLNLYDPDFTRVEVMEFKPAEAPCCSQFTGAHPSAMDPE